jgi:hypothetical protein
MRASGAQKSAGGSAAGYLLVNVRLLGEAAIVR